MDHALYNEIIDDVTELVRRAAPPRRNTLKLSPETAALLESLGAESPAPVTQFQSAPPVEQTPAPGGDRESALAKVAEQVAACTLCGLCETRTQTVFSDGNPHAQVVFVGEAPGEQEDLKGLPFVGRAGQLLTDIIHKGMELDRQSDTYICNVLKCRPPGNRNPNPEEMNLCEPYLVRQLELVQPKVIVALGGIAAKALLKTEASVGSLRGKWHEYHGIPLRVTYHPAYLLRSPGEKRKTWEDIQEVMKFLANP